MDFNLGEFLWEIVKIIFWISLAFFCALLYPSIILLVLYGGKAYYKPYKRSTATIKLVVAILLVVLYGLFLYVALNAIE
jgi:Ca2+/H+ antiporter